MSPVGITAANIIGIPFASSNSRNSRRPEKVKSPVLHESNTRLRFHLECGDFDVKICDSNVLTSLLRMQLGD